MLRTAMIALLAAASIGSLAPDVASTRGGFGVVVRFLNPVSFSGSPFDGANHLRAAFASIKPNRHSRRI
jgi:hypothetical protein